MDITFISDTHLKHKFITHKLNGGDIIVHTGDLTMNGQLSSVTKFLEWFGNLPYRHKIFIAGNHDFYFEKNTQIPDSFLQKGITYLFDSGATIDGLNFWGSPWVLAYRDMAFNLNQSELSKKWNLIPSDTDVLLTHTPPYSILDYVSPDGNLGCRDLLIKVMDLKPKVHAFGHVHFSYGEVNLNSIKFINSSILTEQYLLKNDPIRIQLS